MFNSGAVLATLSPPAPSLGRRLQRDGVPNSGPSPAGGLAPGHLAVLMPAQTPPPLGGSGALSLAKSLQAAAFAPGALWSAHVGRSGLLF
ncbi:hypothetical protein CPLU01_03425 [Colletotrichum plurivorum]|uniref:Uncharacterized protein n=1 Tax=Colletotrichum plurivorum TaxID=2175906 RepID=A0A8H6KSE4_9PEZI|nr:hypothetical protein CPLU01_03425 [Colletotrichum plurivorum]